MRILVMGLPGAGKTTFADALGKILGMARVNADQARTNAKDWDFTTQGRVRQAQRMRDLADQFPNSISDFVAPLGVARTVFAADWTVWLDTIDFSRFPDTDACFDPPHRYDYRIPTRDAERWAPLVADMIQAKRRRPAFEAHKPTTQLLGRYQPWHEGHRALFERALAHTGQVAVMVRSCPLGDKNPFSTDQVERRIRRDLDPEHQGRFEVFRVPNIVRVTYGRDVGYVIEQEHLAPAIEAVSATQKRQGV